MKYKINEVFESLQGEGALTGKPSIFIRFQGCPVGCSWCDTKHTWNVSYENLISNEVFDKKKKILNEWCEMTIAQLLNMFTARSYNSKHVVITGGEPCMYDLTPLCEALEHGGYSCQVETSGTFEINVSVNCWVTLSPKIKMKGGYKVLASSYHKASEIKYPVARGSHISELKNIIEKYRLSYNIIYVQPISMRSKATQLAVKSCIENNWRLSVQLHKYLQID
ncbi:MAG: 7-carboxy-7-deazaguanine synthase QueE [Psychromonas sp.]|nr:7-carboxy-7-deazaguanine synthase QueE [Psychromonas sp.]